MCPLSVVAPEFLRIRKTPVRHSIEEMQRLAEVRGGSCLSAAFRTLHHKLQWRCRQGHTWSAIAGNVLRGSWCRYCAHRVQRSIDEMRQIAISRGGQCLSSEYQNLRTTLEWRCAAGHIWTAPAGAIAARKLCMQCSLVEKYSIEEIHHLAIERAGRCKSSYYINLRNNHTPLLWSCREGHQWLAVPSNVRKAGKRRGTWCPECAALSRRFQDRLTLEDAQEIALERGGRCISEEYLGSQFKLTWQCSLGHTWQAKITPVRRGSWCPECAGNRKLDIKLFHRLAIERGGLCLSGIYRNKDTPLRFQCDAGHRWSSPPRDIKGGSWCPVCARARRKRRYRRQAGFGNICLRPPPKLVAKVYL
jgi:hypothetical protein